MPYIHKEIRKHLDSREQVPVGPGTLNYCITRLAHDYILAFGLSYNNLNEVYGAMLAAAAEFYRTVVAPYEDTKRRENGPISILDEVMEQQG
jgi:hypothetical protein